MIKSLQINCNRNKTMLNIVYFFCQVSSDIESFSFNLLVLNILMQNNEEVFNTCLWEMVRDANGSSDT